MLPTRSARIAFIEPAASPTAHLRQLLEFEGIAVSVFEPADLQRLRTIRADVVVLNQSRLRRSTFDIAMEASGGVSPRPLTSLPPRASARCASPICTSIRSGEKLA
jgi:hypothetical protein